MRKTSLFLISLCLIFPKTHSQEFHLDRQAVLEQFYQNAHIEAASLSLLTNDFDKMQNEFFSTNARFDDELIMEYIHCAIVLSSINVMDYSQERTEHLAVFEKQIKKHLKKTKNHRVLNLYAEYLNSKLSWEKGNFSIINQIPHYYRRSLLLEKDNDEAKVGLATWYVYSCSENTGNINTFIEEQVELVEYLPKIQRYNAYISYSLFYMRIYSTKKSYEYLFKARDIFPEGMNWQIILENYKRGKIGW